MISFWHIVVVLLIAAAFLAPGLRKRLPNVNIRTGYWAFAIMSAVFLGASLLEPENHLTLPDKSRYPLLTSTDDEMAAIVSATKKASAEEVGEPQYFGQAQTFATPKAIDEMGDGSPTVSYQRYKASPILGIGEPENGNVAGADWTLGAGSSAYRNPSIGSPYDTSSGRQRGNTNSSGAIDTATGEFFAPTGSGGYVSSRDGTLYAPSGPNGVTNTRTGEFIPTNR